jgi:hypothetical protein
MCKASDGVKRVHGGLARGGEERQGYGPIRGMSNTHFFSLWDVFTISDD